MARPAGSTCVGGDDLALVQDLHRVPGGAGVDLLSDQPPRHRVQRLADLDVAVRADLGGGPRQSATKSLRGNGFNAARSTALNTDTGAGAVQTAVRAFTGDLPAPGQSGLLHLLAGW